jgi:hypothetical protein
MGKLYNIGEGKRNNIPDLIPAVVHFPAILEAFSPD